MDSKRHRRLHQRNNLKAVSTLSSQSSPAGDFNDGCHQLSLTAAACDGLQGLWWDSDKTLTASGEEMGGDWLTMIQSEKRKGEWWPKRNKEQNVWVPGCVGHGAKNLLSLVDLLVFVRICAFTDTYSGLGSTVWYPWQPQWNLVKDVMSMLFRKTDRQTDFKLAEGQDYKAMNI